MLWILSPNANQEIMVPLRFASMTGSRMTGEESGSRMTGGESDSKMTGSWKTFSFLTSFYKKRNGPDTRPQSFRKNYKDGG